MKFLKYQWQEDACFIFCLEVGVSSKGIFQLVKFAVSIDFAEH